MSEYFDTAARKVSSDWNLLKFEDVVVKVTDRDHFTPTYLDHGVPIISPKDFDANEKISFENCKFISQEAHLKNRKKTDLETDDIVFTRIGAGLGKACLVTSDMPEFSILHSAAMIRVIKSKLNPSYFLFYLKSDLLQRQIALEVQSIGVPDLGLDKIYGFRVLLPPKEQQQRIANILSTVDKLIENTQSLIDKYTAIKQGMMADLFTRGIDLSPGPDGIPTSNPNYGKLRPSVEEAPEFYKETELGWVPKEWEVCIVEDILDRVIDYRGKTPEKTEVGIPLITAKNVRFGFVDPEPREFIATDAYEGWMTRGIPKKGDVLFTTEAPLANVAQIETEDRVAFAQRMIILQPSDKCNNTFLKYLLMSSSFREKIFSRGSGSTVEGVKQSEFRKVLLKLPVSIEEQIRIVESLEAITDKISMEEHSQEKYKKQKKGLMQDLLTGKVIVN